MWTQVRARHVRSTAFRRVETLLMADYVEVSDWPTRVNAVLQTG